MSECCAVPPPQVELSSCTAASNRHAHRCITGRGSRATRRAVLLVLWRRTREQPGSKALSRTSSDLQPSAPPLPDDRPSAPPLPTSSGDEARQELLEGSHCAAALPPAAGAAAKEPAGGGASAGCVICMDAPQECTLAPCGHRCVCLACVASLLRRGGCHAVCPMCRQQIASFIRREFVA